MSQERLKIEVTAIANGWIIAVDYISNLGNAVKQVFCEQTPNLAKDRVEDTVTDWQDP